MRELTSQTKRIVTTVVGSFLILIGVVRIVAPILPGWIVVFAGLAVLAKEHDWSRRLLAWLKAKIKV